MKYVYLVAAVLLFSVTAAAQNPRREARLQERYERHQAAMRSMDSLVLSRDFRFMPNTVQLMPAGRMNYITNIRYSIDVYPNGSVEFFLPFIYGAVAPYNMVLLNYLSARVADYTAVQTDQGW